MQYLDLRDMPEVEAAFLYEDFTIHHGSIM